MFTLKLPDVSKNGKLNLPLSGISLLTMTAVVTFSDRFAESS